MALTEDTPLTQELGNVGEYGVKASAKVYEGAAVGSSSGYARGLIAGDLFLGFAESQADNTSGQDGDISVRVLQRGAVELAVSGAAITDLGASVYATADGTFAFAGDEDSRVGAVVRFVSTGVVVVKFDAIIQRNLGAGS